MYPDMWQNIYQYHILPYSLSVKKLIVGNKNRVVFYVL